MLMDILRALALIFAAPFLLIIYVGITVILAALCAAPWVIFLRHVSPRFEAFSDRMGRRINEWLIRRQNSL